MKTMVKKLIFIVVLTYPIFGYGQNDSLRYIFEKILNQYRVENSLNKIKIDVTYRERAESHLNYMVNQKAISHSDMYKNIKNCVGENVAYTPTFSKEDMKYIVTFLDMDSIITKLIKDANISVQKNNPNFVLAVNLFKQWKDSPDHNKTLLNKNSETYYLTYKTTTIDRVINGRLFPSYFLFSEYVTFD
jgi:hypothetical protein